MTNLMHDQLLNSQQLSMDDLTLRFSHLTEKIFKSLNNETVAECKETSKFWYSFLGAQKFVQIRVIIAKINQFHRIGKSWNHVFKTATTKTIMDLGQAVEQFYQKNPRMKFHQGLTPIHVAAATGHFDLLKLIEDKTREKYPEDGNGWLPYHYAAQNGHIEICEIYIEQQGDKNPGTKCRVPTSHENGWTPLHAAAKFGHFAICKLIMAKIEDKNPKTLDGFTPLHAAAEHGHIKIYKKISARLEDKNPRKNDGITPLHAAAAKGQLRMFGLIMAELEDKNPGTNQGN